jgi:integrase
MKKAANLYGSTAYRNLVVRDRLHDWCLDRASVSDERGGLKQKAEGKPHVVPLSRQAVAVLKDIRPLTAHKVKVFPSERSEGRSISENTCRQAFARWDISTMFPTDSGFLHVRWPVMYCDLT